MSQEIRKLRWALLTLVLLIAHSGLAAVPDWVRQAAAQPLGTYPDDTKAIVLLSETTYDVSGGGEYQTRYRRVVKIVRPDGRREGNLSVGFGKDEKVQSIHAWTV